MKALVYHGPGQRALEDKPKPAAKEPTDAVVKGTHTTICGTDLHIMKGDILSPMPRKKGSQGHSHKPAGGGDQ